MPIGLFSKKNKWSCREVSRFVEFGGTFTFSEWINLTEEEKIIAGKAFLKRREIDRLSLAFLLTDNEEKKFSIAEALSQYDGGALLKLLHENKARMVELQLKEIGH